MTDFVCVRVPATCANLGPGFDSLGMTLDLWNEVEFRLRGSGFRHLVEGEGREALNEKPHSLLESAFYRTFAFAGHPAPEGVQALARNRIPLSSGLGSSAAAVIGGLLAANALMEGALTGETLLNLASELEGHPDNAAPALLGGLTASVKLPNGEILTRRFNLPPLQAVIVRPEVELLTRAARAVLPRSVLHTDAVFNLSRAPLVMEALRSADLSLLEKVMDDRLHQPYRLAHIPGGQAAYETAKGFGAAALAGAGPSLLVLPRAGQAEPALQAIQAAFRQAGIESRGWLCQTTNLFATWEKG